MSWSTPLPKYRDILHMLSNPFKLGLTREEINDGDLSGISEREQKVFSFQSLASATNNFHSTRKLGQGGFGPVFKGKLQDGREIAVKKLSQGSNQGKKEFINEAKLLINVQHRNVVTLLGYCAFGEEKLLVYEYLKNQSIDKLLFNTRRKGELNWKKRYNIITGMVRGLLYLHEDSPNCIIHRDIKASNILLDDKWLPKIADFGLARLFGGDNTHVHTRVVGTNGYMAPEYVSHGKLSTKADVFSFGVVVLELVSGQRNSTFDQDPNSTNLLDWSFKLYKKGRRMEIVDPSLGRLEEAEEEQVSVCIQIALLCTQLDPHLRPGMTRVQVALFKKPGTLEDEPTWPGCCPGLKHANHRQTAGVASSSKLGRSSHESFGYTNTTSPDSTRTSTSFGQVDNHLGMKKNKIKKNTKSAV